MRLAHYLFTTTCCFLFLLQAAAQNSPAPIKLVDILLTPDAKDWNYAVNQQASVEVTVLKYGMPQPDVEISFEAGPELLPPDKKGKLTLRKGSGKINLGTSKEPGFRQLVVRAKLNGHTYSNTVKVGYSPDKIKPTVPLPSDFVSFWDKAKAEAAKLPLDPQYTHLPAYSTATADVYLVSVQSYQKGRRLYGYLTKPKAPGKYPILFAPPGAGIKPMQPFTGFADQGYISFTTEIHGLSPQLDSDTYKSISTAFGDYTLNKLDDKDNYYYKSVYLGCVRAIDFLTSLPEFDGKNVLVTGGSQGGALAIVTAALDKRVTALAAFYPALSDMTGYLHGRAGGWPHLLAPRQQATNNTPAKLHTISYYDVVNFAKQITVPGFYSWGYNDNTCPPTSVFAAINAVTAPKTIAITPISGHWRFEETNLESLEWLKKQLK
ncbi:acetylxylan esterase [Pontibacter qinzhouensis]|uniref:Acetylxylan esterase n=1 Tax=Pontibacter qinzhouensis TaxID=2603253 RepID=A0A5C8JGI3_9BACT|nr:acetylxylan esterase [Pontibacter qinzhouensis]TXK36491.1 acetylxylan esterase [Pontibacter qinzhouensis]